MPEGDTVWRTAHHLDRALGGRELTGCDIRVPAYATVDLTGTVVDGVVSRGKHLLTRVGRHSIHTHLKMEGAWHLYRPGGKWRRPGFEARIVLSTSEWQAVGFALGTVEVLPRDAEDTVVGHLGPDLLGSDWDPAVAVANLQRDPERPLGEALLDQRNLAGIGNLYRNELAFLFGLPPDARVREVATLDTLVQRAHQLLVANRDRTQQITTGDLRRGQGSYVYRRAGQLCRRCGTRIRSAASGPADRSREVFWCPVCQA